MSDYFTGFAVVGAGNLGVTFTVNIVRQGEIAYLTPVAGHPGNIPAIEKAGGEVTATGLLTGTHKIDTAALDDVMAKVKDVVITTVADGHPDLIRAFARKYDLTGQTLYFTPGGHGPALVSRITLPARAPTVIITLGNSPWVCRIDPSAEKPLLDAPAIKIAMPVSITYRPVAVSALNTAITKAAAEQKIKALLPEGEEPVIMEPALVFLCEANPTLHVAIMLAGAAEIKAGKDCLFYGELGIKPEAIKGVIAADWIRQQIVQKLGAAGSWPDVDIVGLLEKYYDYKVERLEDDTAETILARLLKTAPYYKTVKAPKRMDVRQLSEDGELQHILVHIAKKLDIDTTVMEEQMDKTERELGYKLGNSPINPFTLGLTEANTAEELRAALNGRLPHF